MIVGCPSCEARYRIDPSRLRSEGSRLRCARCEAVFRVHPPAEEASSATAAPEPAPVPEPPAPTAAPAGPRAPDAEADADPGRIVLVADSVPELGKLTAGAVASWGLQPLLVHDGVEAILSIQRTLPRVAVLDVALPKMFGFQICELMKRNESLREIPVVLVTSAHRRDRDRFLSGESYAADAYLERPELPDGLRPVLERLGLSISDGAEDAAPRAVTPVAEAPPPRRAPTLQPVHPPAAPAPPVSRAPEPARSAVREEPPTAEHAVPEFARPLAPPPPEPAKLDPAEVAKAERLARIIVSDIALYNQEKFDAAVAAGNVVEAMQDEVAEGRTLFSQRIDPEVRAARDFLREELERVARSRGSG